MALPSKSSRIKATAAAIRRVPDGERLSVELLFNPHGLAYISRSVHLPKPLKDGSVTAANSFAPLATLSDAEAAAALAGDVHYAAAADEGDGGGYEFDYGDGDSDGYGASHGEEADAAEAVEGGAADGPEQGSATAAAAARVDGK